MSDLRQHDPQFFAAAEFFVSLKKEAAPSLRAHAREVTRSVVQTNALPENLKRPEAPQASPVKTPVAKATPPKEVLKDKLSSAMQKEAIAEKLLVDLAHHGSRLAGTVGKEMKALGRGVRKDTAAFKAGYNTPKSGFEEKLKEKLHLIGAGHRSREGAFKTLGKVVGPHSEKIVGSDAFYASMAKKKGQRYADMFRRGQGVKGSVDPDVTNSAIHHLVDEKGGFTPLSVLKGVHTLGIVSPETSAGVVRRAIGMGEKAKSSNPFGLTNTQLALGGGTAAGLGYLALRKRSKE